MGYVGARGGWAWTWQNRKAAPEGPGMFLLGLLVGFWKWVGRNQPCALEGV